MDEFSGARYVRMTGVVIHAEPGRKMVWQTKNGVRLAGRDVIQNRNNLQGEHDALTARGATTVGVYSTTSGWQTITGGWQNG